MKTLRTLGTIAVIALLVAVSPTRARAQAADSAAVADKWGWIIEPYFLLPTMSGTTGVHGLTADVSASTSDILSMLKFGAMLYLEAHSPKWAFSLDGLYMHLGDSGTTRTGTVDVDVEQSGVLASGYRRVAPWAEAQVGVQFNSLKGALKKTGLAPVDINDTKSWVDPYLGARLTAPGQSNWMFRFDGLIGGFGVGSDFAWQAYPEIGYRFSHWFELSGGYRAMYMDYTQGSGSDEFTYKMTTYGPQLGAKFKF